MLDNSIVSLQFVFWWDISSQAKGSASQVEIGALEYPPYGTFKNGMATGFAFDIIRAAFKSQGYKVKFIEYPFARLIKNGTNEDLDAFQMDLDFFPAKLRKQVYVPSPYFYTFLSIFSKKSVIPMHPEFDENQKFYKGKIIGSINSANLGSALELFKKMELKVESTNNLIGGMQMLNSNRIHFLYAAEPSVLFWMKNQGFQILDLNITRLRKSNAHLVFNKNRKAYRELSDSFMEGMTVINSKSSAINGGKSLMSELVNKYFGESSSLKRFWPKQFKKIEWEE
ncbi:MAG: substrate-binding periplasmic protein [Oligoflexales bacterium]